MYLFVQSCLGVCVSLCVNKPSVSCICSTLVNIHSLMSDSVSDTNMNPTLTRCSPNTQSHLPTTVHNTATFFSVLCEWNPSGSRGSCLFWITSSTKQNMQPLPRGHWIVAEHGVFQIHLFVLWSGWIRRKKLQAKSHRLMFKDRLEATE